jgi:hypothetical protein
MHQLEVSIQDVWKLVFIEKNEISINDLKADVIVLTASMFVNLKLHLLNDIIFSKFIKHVIVKAKQTYIKKTPLSLVLASKWISVWKDPPRHYSIALNEPASVVHVCALGACYWSAPNDS